MLGLALLWALNPVLLGIILLVISRQRPVQNLLVCWVGCMITNVPALLIPLLALHGTPMFRSYAKSLATPDTGAGSPVRHLQIGMGVLALSIAAVMAARLWARRRACAPALVGHGSTLVLDPDAPNAISRPEGNDAATDGGSAIRRMFGRVNKAWENGSLWVALVIGMGFLPGPPLILIVDTTIAASGASIGTQVIAAIAFVVGMLAVFEIVLVSHLVTPARTKAVLRPIHDWSMAHRPRVLAAIFTAVGCFQLVRGLGLF